VLAVSPDPNQRSQELAERLKVSYRFLADTDLAVTRKLGLVHVHGGPEGKDVPRPTTALIGRDGVVRYAANGAFDKESFDSLLTPLLAEPAPAER